jgi:KRAB domain-containing zinc finger protein
MSTIWLCSDCGANFPTTASLKKHKRVHDDRVFNCGECEKDFVGMKKFGDHFRSHQTTECSICSQTVPKNSFNSHQLKCAGSGKITKCSLCFYETTSNSHLKRHMKVHAFNTAKEMLFNCNHCQKTFSLKKHLTQHQKIHLKTKEETKI